MKLKHWLCIHPSQRWFTHKLVFLGEAARPGTVSGYRLVARPPSPQGSFARPGALPRPERRHASLQRTLLLLHCSYEPMRQTKSLPPSPASALTMGLCRLLPVPAGRWPFPTLSPQSVYRRLDPYPAAPLRCFSRFFPKGFGLASDVTGSARQKNNVAMQLQRRGSSRGCSHSFMFRLPYLLDPPVAPTAANPSRRAAGPFTPRNAHLVTQHEPWYRYVPESGNWHGGTSTRWIAALSAASHIPEPNKHLVHFYGTYANRSRSSMPYGRDSVQNKGAGEGKPAPAKRAVRKRWAELIYKIHNVDPLTCRCGAQMKIVAFVTEPITYCS